MASTIRAPKQWRLAKVETVNSFESWRQNIIYTLSLDPCFASFMIGGTTWLKQEDTHPLRGFVDDPDTVAAANRRTAAQKVMHLEMMLGQIANYADVIHRNNFVVKATCLNQIWQTLRMHYGFQSTGGHFLDFSEITRQSEERPEDLYQRLMSFVEDNLLKHNGNITHHGELPDHDEQLAPSLENIVVLTWLKLIHQDLPKLVKQRYGTELRSRTLASIKPEISQALDSLLEEVQCTQDAKISRAAGIHSFSQRKPKPASYSKSSSYKNKECPLCKQAKRSDYYHFMSTCKFLPDREKKYMTRARLICHIDEEVSSDEEEGEVELPTTSPTTNRRVQVKQSPFINMFYKHHNLKITVDSGAETNMIRESCAVCIGAKVTKSSQVANQADGFSPLQIIGETRITVTRDHHELVLEALVVKSLDVDILAGVPFMYTNDVFPRPAKHQVSIGDHIYTYGSQHTTSTSHTVRRTQSHIVRASRNSTTIWPGEFVEVSVPDDFCSDAAIAVEPRLHAPKARLWPEPDVMDTVGGKIRLPNNTTEPITLSRHEQFCQIHHVISPMEVPSDEIIAGTCKISPCSTVYSNLISVNPDKVLPPEIEAQFRDVNTQFDDVFNPAYSGYNGASGPFKAVVNMGPVLPPQRKGRVPQYSRDKLSALQDKFDELEEAGVFKRPEDIQVVAEYINPSFLIKKPSGDFRLVTAFADVGRYCKPQPALMPDVDSTLRAIACWKYVIVADLTSSFFQIPLSKESIKYCGVATPFKGVRVYTRCAMGMPGSETALEELMCRILGDLVKEGSVAKLADDLYCGGNTPSELLANWKKVLVAMQSNNMKLSAKKTIIAPKTTTILGWEWSLGSIHASPHRVATLSNCPIPSTVNGMRSYIGAYKVLSRVLPSCAKYLDPLDQVVAGRESKEKIVWNESLKSAFELSQGALLSNKAIVLPRPSDQLWIVTDGAVKSYGLGATLYVMRKDKLLLSGFYSAKLRKRQVTWIPCEIEALSISAAIKHFSPYIIQSRHQACVLTDSKPCVQSCEKLCRGEFSSSARISTFLSAVSRYQVSIRHLAGSANLPSDFASRNAPVCETPNCQICSFIATTEDSVVLNVSVKDIITGTAKLPFTSRVTWLTTQSECYDMRRVNAHLRQGTRPSKKANNIRDIKRYLNVATIAKDGLLVVKKIDPLAPTRECIIVPRQVIPGLITAIHLRLDHPSAHQLKMVCHRYLYALDMDKNIDEITKLCHQCASLKHSPPPVAEQSTSDPPESVGITFSADVLKRERQLICVLRENVTSFTSACIIENEQATSLRDALVRLCAESRPLDGPLTVIRVDPAPGFVSLVKDELLHSQRISLEVGRPKNVNKNPIAERAIQEVEQEMLRQDATGGPVSPMTLTIIIARLNSRIRSEGLSSREMWYQRDQFTNMQIPVSDRQMILNQHHRRLTNHPYSERSKGHPGTTLSASTTASVGDLVYIHAERNKTHARPRYLVVSADKEWCQLRKFTGTQLRNTSYKVKIAECFKVPTDSNIGTSLNPLMARHGDEYYDNECEGPIPMPQNPPTLPVIPPSLSQVPETTVPEPTIETSNDMDLFVCAPVSHETHNKDYLSLEPPIIQEDPFEDNPPSPDKPCRPKRKHQLPKRFMDFVME